MAAESKAHYERSCVGLVASILERVATEEQEEETEAADGPASKGKKRKARKGFQGRPAFPFAYSRIFMSDSLCHPLLLLC